MGPGYACGYYVRGNLPCHVGWYPGQRQVRRGGRRCAACEQRHKERERRRAISAERRQVRVAALENDRAENGRRERYVGMPPRPERDQGMRGSGTRLDPYYVR